MITSSIRHDYKNEMQSVIDLNTLEITLEAARDDISRVVLIYGPRYSDNPDANNKIEMNLKYRTNYHDIFSVRLNLDDTRLRYLFYLEDYRGNRVWYNEKGFFETRPEGYDSGYFQKAIINKSDVTKFSEWAQDAVIYQIFPDRFFRTDGDNYKNREWHQLPKTDSIYGGDLRGIIKKLDYLVDLGVNTLYLTPIFKSPSNHKYNIDDYYQIDPNFGSIEDAKELSKRAKARGIKLIIDAVFNHSGSNFFAFEDLLTKGENSKYRDWYFPESLPVSKEKVNYSTFANDIKDMPRLNLDNPAAQDYFLEVAEYWTSELDLDGWRLDVADEVSRDFWKKFRKKIKNINKDIFIIGEVWYRASNWLDGNTFDSVMNYDLQRDIYSLIIEENMDVDQFSSQIQENFRHYHPEKPDRLVNLLDTHDTARFNWELRNYDKEISDQKMKFAISLQFLLPGIPLIYYGSEIGLTGADDPDCRRTMIWDQSKQNQELFAYYKKIISYYKKKKVLRNGDYKELFVDPLNKILIFSRGNKGRNQNRIVVIINMSNRKQEINDKNIMEILKNKNLSFSINKNNISFNNNCFQVGKKQLLIYS
ncbi:glycosidase [Halanaerobium saccharolyticum]|uniref:Glycosidase n=1 Tax=Halanaerobium saccharolyticum TaxID=43595 RepID=A0A4R6LBL8_9FIRM|nr:glycoside hydrolase family 13 protein [Halanaerobium saccharolyticum]TDO73357.1 glycosidase [Halanaerobium saccharolyticum]